MKTYWDYTDKEQAEMQEEQVRALLDVELMTHGVKKPVAPTLVEVPKCPLGDKQKRFAIHAKGKYGSDERFDVLFNTIEQAQAFIDLCPSIADYDYEVGSEFHYLKPVTGAKIAAEDFYTEEQISEFRSELKNRKAKTEANATAQSEYQKACQKAEKITNGVWSDWFAKQAIRRDMLEIVSTFKQYTSLAGGNAAIAITFLAKAYTPENIAQAREWFPNELPAEPATEQPKE